MENKPMSTNKGTKIKQVINTSLFDQPENGVFLEGTEVVKSKTSWGQECYVPVLFNEDPDNWYFEIEYIKNLIKSGLIINQHPNGREE